MLKNEIFNAIRGKCISDESAAAAVEEISRLVEENRVSTRNEANTMMICERCKYFEGVNHDTGMKQCGDPVSWYDPATGEEVCRYYEGAVQHEEQKN